VTNVCSPLGKRGHLEAMKPTTTSQSRPLCADQPRAPGAPRGASTTIPVCSKRDDMTPRSDMTRQRRLLP
jgi:hypothetical protein